MHWKVAIVYDETDGRPAFHGVTHEISLAGLSLLTDHNLFAEEAITLLLVIPPKHLGQRNKIVEIRARMTYTVHSSGHDQFRIGLRFEHFKGKGGAILEKTLKERAIAHSSDDTG